MKIVGAAFAILGLAITVSLCAASIDRLFDAAREGSMVAAISALQPSDVLFGLGPFLALGMTPWLRSAFSPTLKPRPIKKGAEPQVFR